MFACIHEKTLPAWYELGFTEKGKSLLVSVSPSSYQSLISRISADLPVVAPLREEFGLPAFVPPTVEHWGFGPIVQRAPEIQPEWVTWQCPLPQFVPSTPKGRRDLEAEVDWPKLWSVAATLHILFAALYGIKDKGSCPKAQLLECALTPGHGLGQCGIWVGVSPALRRWLSQQPQGTAHPILGAVMQTAYKQMYGLKKLSAHDQRTIYALTQQPGVIMFQTIGDACDLGSGGRWELDQAEGYLLSPHNVDSPLQQLTLLMGAAAMYQLARHDGF
jgi:hypothetical protein